MPTGPDGPRQPPSPEALRRAKGRARQLVATIDGVTGVGIGDGTVRVYVRTRDVVDRLPDEIDEVPVEPVVVGDVTPY